LRVPRELLARDADGGHALPARRLSLSAGGDQDGRPSAPGLRRVPLQSHRAGRRGARGRRRGPGRDGARPHCGPVHRVERERASEVGGQVNVAARITARSEFTHARTWFEERCRKLGVAIECGVEATAERIVAFRPDAVVLATGSTPRRTAIPGAANVYTVAE